MHNIILHQIDPSEKVINEIQKHFNNHKTSQLFVTVYLCHSKKNNEYSNIEMYFKTGRRR